MAWQIQIYRAKLNPSGRDLSGGYPRPEQLLGEWVDLRNIGNETVQLSHLHLADLKFDDRCRAQEKPEIYWNGTAGAYLAPGQILRVHTGRNSGSMSPVDRSGADVHAFADRNSFVLNNRCGDTISVWWKDSNSKWNREDEAEYAPNPHDGVILNRYGRNLA